MDITRELNYDILHLIMSLCQRHEISTMMKTCKLLNLQGAKLLLSDFVTLDTENDITSFVAFMLGGSGNLDRFDQPLRVHFTVESPSPESVADLRDFLFEYGHLLWCRALIISHAEQLLAVDLHLPDALAEIGFINYIHVAEAGPLARAMLQEMKNEVFDVRVDFELRNKHYRFLPDDLQNNPILVLAPLYDTLCSVSGTWGGTDPAKTVYEDIVFHDVTSLELYTKDPIHVSHYAHAFPNVLDLSVSASVANGILLDEAQIITVCTEFRNRNRVAQRAHGSWARLERFHGSMHNWWALGLECEVERVEVSDLLEWQFGMFGEMLRVARPKYLVLDVRASTATLEAFGTLFRRQATQFLAGLRLDVSFDPLDRDELNASTMLDTVVASCAGMAQLQWLQVNLDCWRLRYESLLNRTGGFRGGPTMNDAPICPPEAFFAQLDLPVLAQRLKTEVPTLQGMRVKFQDLRGRERDMVHLGEQFPPDAEWDRLDRYH